MANLFRHSAGQITATLVRVLGPDRLELAEEAVSEAMLRALRVWPDEGVPDNPRGWLFRTARNRAIDELRREESLRGKLVLLDEPGTTEQTGDDAELALIFLCCHPGLPQVSQVALTLKTVGGLGVEEIAAALLSNPSTVAQRLVRAKRWLRADAVRIEVPPPDELPARVDSVLAVLYLLFNAGYDATTGENAIRHELCGEAIRLCSLVLADRRTDLPRARALLALMQLQASRLPARLNGSGDPLLLAEQDRSKWDQALIASGARNLAGAAQGSELSPYHVEAAIAVCHASARDEQSTDWLRIVSLYDQLLALRPSPVVELNRGIALAMADGPQAGIAILEGLANRGELANYVLLPSALGALRLRADDPARAAVHYREALELPCSEPTRRFLANQLAKCTR
ncbi:RNA polymerase sigma-70 factor (ECF subfamily) [Tamaricihabitans halophyticus]|uniref:RNA polymerase sigma-70 factor (ECF subfamily) n=1 Tax=Tamaricihabitans halophyticus TaxID=1262583 RepID=A0A4R2R445_9PSEU|nr:RNA polymerase sigma-70 factor (ECF subfamily) [Tamaricihabitans halophyticus]